MDWIAAEMMFSPELKLAVHQRWLNSLSDRFTLQTGECNSTLQGAIKTARLGGCSEVTQLVARLRQ